MQLEPLLRAHKVVPLWTLPDKYGEPFNLAKKRGRAHFLLLVCGEGADPAPFLQQLAPVMPAIRTLPAEGIVVVPSEDAAGPLSTHSFTVLVDAEGSVRARFLPEGAAAGLFLLDRYADLYRQWLVASIGELPSPEEISGWMEAISNQCGI